LPEAGWEPFRDLDEGVKAGSEENWQRAKVYFAASKNSYISFEEFFAQWCHIIYPFG